MTFEEAHKNGKRGLVTRNGLNKTELLKRLSNYFTNYECNDIIRSAMCVNSWTDGNIAIIATNNEDDEKARFTAVANGNFMELIRP